MGNPEPNLVHEENVSSPKIEGNRCRDSMEAILMNESHLVQYCSYRKIYLHLKNGERCYITSDKTGDHNLNRSKHFIHKIDARFELKY